MGGVTGGATMGMERASVLLVDDRPGTLTALEAVLADLDADIVKAASGREALRCVLQREFAVILLDVHMPVMDGFQTASLIRQRPASERTPIIFVTAYSEDMHVARGYSLGAVDYIVAPIVPEVLRTKVSVFIDLFNAVRQQRRHVEALERHARRLSLLTCASQAVNSGASLDEILDLTLYAAREILGATICGAALLAGERRVHARQLVGEAGAAAPASDAVLEALRDPVPSLSSGEVRRLTGAADGVAGAGVVPRLAGMVTPLAGHDGCRVGVLVVAERADGPRFDVDDESLTLQLAQIAGIAVENLSLAQEREANQVKEEFLSTLSHELRTPLGAILGWVRLLQKGHLDGETSSRALAVIERNVKAQSKLIDDLLDISRIASGKLRLAIEPLRIRELLETAVETARPTAEEKGVALAFESATEIAEIPGDPGRLQQVVWNLLVNAIKFTPRGGRVDVRLGSHGATVTIDIRDTGKGIAPEFLPHVFERFRQADGGPARKQGGLGIGLAVVRHITELHGGTVTARSDGEDRGATFTVSLPARAAARAEVTTVASAERPGRTDLHGVRVLLVDDEADTRDMVREVLCACGAEVTAVESAALALRALDDGLPDVIVSDLAMPTQDGWSLLAAIRARIPGDAPPAIALSAYAGGAERLRSQAVGFVAHLAKPVEPEEIAGAVATAVSRGVDGVGLAASGSQASLATGGTKTADD